MEAGNQLPASTKYFMLFQCETGHSSLFAIILTLPRAPSHSDSFCRSHPNFNPHPTGTASSYRLCRTFPCSRIIQFPAATTSNSTPGSLRCRRRLIGSRFAPLAAPAPRTIS